MVSANNCARCGRALKNKDSIEAGMGPTCLVKARKSDSGRLLDDQPVLNDVGSLGEVGLVCRKLADGRFACNIPQVIRYHSPTGFAWGYAGSGPSDLALNVLHFLLPPRDDEPVTIFRDAVRGEGIEVSARATALYQDFKRQFISMLGEEGGVVRISTIRSWIEESLAEVA